MRTVTYSEISTFKSCRLKHQYIYDEGLTPREPSKHLRFGSAIHEALEAYHGTETEDGIDAFQNYLNAEIALLEADPEVELWDEDYEQFEEERRLGKAMLSRYADFDAKQEPFTVIALEKEFSVRLKTPKGTNARTIFAGKVDGLVKDMNGNLFILEHKTAANIDSRYVANLEIDEQVSAYVWALTELGLPVQGVIYNVLAKWIPSPPTLLKSGKLSTDKRQRTTLDLYLKAIQENGLDPSDYQEMLEMLREKGNNSLLRLKVYRNEIETKRTGRELYQTVRDMTKPHIYRNPSTCRLNGCSMRSLCIEDSSEARLSFRVKAARHEELEEVSNG